jgi:hypothetical protein
MRAVVGAFAIAVCLSNVGCSKGLDCGPGGFSNADPPFCLKMPEGYEAAKPQGKSPISVSVHPKSSILGFTVYWNEGNDSLAERSKRVSGMTAGSLKLEGSGDIPRGKWWKFRTTMNTTFAVVLAEGKGGVIRCELQNRPDADASKELEACKSMQVQ